MYYGKWFALIQTTFFQLQIKADIMLWFVHW